MKKLLLMSLISVVGCFSAQLYADPPDWTINPGDFQFSAAVTAQLKTDGVVRSDTSHVVGFFAGNELRGVGTPLASMNTVYYFPTLYANVSSGEQMSIRVYLGDRDEILLSEDSIAFVHNTFTGDIATPFEIRVQILNQNPIQLDFTAEAPYCERDSTGMLTVLPTNGVAPYAYLWSNGDTTVTVDSLPIGQHQVTVTDALGNQVVGDTSLHAQLVLPQPIVAVNQGIPVCYGSDIALTAGSNRNDLEFWWFADSTDKDVKLVGDVMQVNNVSSDQTWYVESALGVCRSYERVRADIDVVHLSAEFTVNRRLGNSGTSFRFSPLYDRNVTSYRWRFGDGNLSLAKHPTHQYEQQGTYWAELEVSGAGVCMDRYVVPIEVRDAALWVQVNSTAATCSEAADGVLRADVINGRAPYTYRWSNGAQTQTVTGLTAGVYRVTVTDANGERVVGSGEVGALQTTLAAPEILINGGGTICPGTDLVLLATGGDARSSILWYDASDRLLGTGRALNLAASSQSREISAVQLLGACQSERSQVTLAGSTFAGALKLSARNILPEEQLELSLTGIPAAAQITWDFGDGETVESGEQQFHSYAAGGVYVITVSIVTEASCVYTLTDQVIVGQPTALLLSLQASAPQCWYSQDGWIDAEVTGGTAPYQYQWSTGAQVAQLGQAASGFYRVTVTDARGDKAIDSIQLRPLVDTLLAPEVVLSAPEGICRGESVILSAYSDALSATYRWYSEPVGNQLAYAGEQVILYDVQQSANLWVESRQGQCQSATRTPVAVEVSGPTASIIYNPQPISVGSIVRFQAEEDNPEWSYYWDFGDGVKGFGADLVHSFENQGVYTVELEVEDAGGCKMSTRELVYVSAASGLQATFQVADCHCHNELSGSIRTQIHNGTPPYRYLWSTGATSADISGLGVGEYELTVTDVQGQEYVGGVTLKSQVPELQAPEILSTAGGRQNLVCTGNELVLFALQEGDDQVEYAWYDAPRGGRLLARANTLDLGPVQKKQELFVETQQSGCRSMERTPVEVLIDGALLGFTVDRRTVEIGDTLSFVALGEGNLNAYSWDLGDGTTAQGPEVNHTYDAAGHYDVSLQVRTLGGCDYKHKEKEYLEVVDREAFGVFLQTVSPTCSSGHDGQIEAALVNGQAPFQYAWSNGASDPVLDSLEEGTYQVTITDSNGLTLVDSVKLTARWPSPARPQIAVVGDSIWCAGDVLTLLAWSPSGEVPGYEWFDNQGTKLGSGTSYMLGLAGNRADTVRLRAVNGVCPSPLVERVFEGRQLDASFNVLPGTAVVAGDPVQFVPSILTYEHYQWRFGDGKQSESISPTHTYAQDGAYDLSLRVQDSVGCIGVAQYSGYMQVQEEVYMEVSESVRHAFCAEDSLSGAQLSVYRGLPPYVVNWSDGAEGLEREALPQGIYGYTITDAGARVYSDSIRIRLQPHGLPPATVDVNGGQQICNGMPYYIQASHELDDVFYRWYDDAGSFLQKGSVLPGRGDTSIQKYYIEANLGGCHSAWLPVTIEPYVPDIQLSVNPATSIQAGDALRFSSNLEANGYDFFWTFGDGGWSFQAAPWYIYNKEGNYKVQLEVVDPTGCRWQTTFEDDLGVGPWADAPGIGEEALQGLPAQQVRDAFFELRAYPNPFETGIYLTIYQEGALTEQLQVQLKDVLGRIVQVWQWTANEWSGEAYLELPDGLNTGMYWLEVTSGDWHQLLTLMHK